jgi:hypothetical protein
MIRAGLAVALALAGCASPESRAVAYLSREVPAWAVENRCFSCHNNGDAARALLAADVAPPVLASTLAFLRAPERWAANDPDKEFGDPRLAAVQFGLALAAAGAAPEVLARAADLVAAGQGADGAWEVDAGGLPGSPVTYGRTLATVAARRVLAAGGRHAAAVAKADAWLRARRPPSVLDAGALLWGGVREHAAECLDLLRRGQHASGGWGPGVASPPEVFDTAVALLGLAEVDGPRDLVARGRAFLEREQRADGSWPETTRPPGAESYAQRISTTGWALLALTATAKY